MESIVGKVFLTNDAILNFTLRADLISNISCKGELSESDIKSFLFELLYGKKNLADQINKKNC